MSPHQDKKKTQPHIPHYPEYYSDHVFWKRVHLTILAHVYTNAAAINPESENGWSVTSSIFTVKTIEKEVAKYFGYQS